MKIEDIDTQDGSALAIYFIPKSEGVREHYTFEMIGGPKKYLNLWLGESETLSWGWVVHESAILIWKMHR